MCQVCRGLPSVFGHVSGPRASLVLAKLLWQRRKLLNWLGIGLSETGSCNNVKVVKPPGIFKELSAATQGERQWGGRTRRERWKEPENDRECRDLFTAQSGADDEGGGRASHWAYVTYSSDEEW